MSVGPEFRAQCKVFQYVRGMRLIDERYCLISSSQNGAFLGGGARTYDRLYAAGLEPGFPDIQWNLPVHGLYGGLFIELKIKPNKPSEQQLRWIDRLNTWGNYAVICYGWKDAVKEIDNYAKLHTKHQALVQPLCG